jgi:hypothetical protein
MSSLLDWYSKYCFKKSLGPWCVDAICVKNEAQPPSMFHSRHNEELNSIRMRVLTASRQPIIATFIIPHYAYCSINDRLFRGSFGYFSACRNDTCPRTVATYTDSH